VRRSLPLALALLGCSDPTIVTLEIPAGARTLVYAQLSGDAAPGVQVIDLAATQGPAIRLELDRPETLRAAAIFYAPDPGTLGLPLGPLPSASGEPSLPLPEGSMARYESAGASWVARAEVPALLAGYRFSLADECLGFEVIETVLTSSARIIDILPIDADRALVLNETADPTSQLAIVTSTGASFLPGRAISGTPTAATIEDGELYVASYEITHNALWRGAFDRGLARVSASATIGEHFRYLARDLGATPPRIYGTTSFPALIELGATPWREMWRGAGGHERGGMVYDAEGHTLLANVSGDRNLQLVLSIHDGTFDIEPAPVARGISGLGRALGSVWLGMSFGGAFRRSGHGWISFEHPGFGDVRAFVEIGRSMIDTTEDGHLLQYIEGAGYCPPQRVSDIGIYRALRLGADQLLIATQHRDRPSEVLRVRVRL